MKKYIIILSLLFSSSLFAATQENSNTQTAYHNEKIYAMCDLSKIEIKEWEQLKSNNEKIMKIVKDDPIDVSYSIASDILNFNIKYCNFEISELKKLIKKYCQEDVK